MRRGPPGPRLRDHSSSGATALLLLHHIAWEATSALRAYLNRPRKFWAFHGKLRTLGGSCGAAE